MGNCLSESKPNKTQQPPKKPASHPQNQVNGSPDARKPDHAGANAQAQKHHQPQSSRASRRGGAFQQPILDTKTEDITTLYTMGKVLGRGQFGTTRLCEERSTGRRFACKSISKFKLPMPEDVEDVKREIQILHHLGGHPNITQLQGVYEDRHNVHLVMELCSGGELFDRIVSRGHYSEKDAAFLTRTIVRVVGHCHSLGVMHRDLKPENFLLSSTAENSALKGCDFGLSVFFKPSQKFTSVVGSPFYVAPEVLQRSYGKEVDIWSAGVILYILLCGVPPFWGDTEVEIFESVLHSGPPDFSSDPWPSISADAKDCVRCMLERNPAKRATADQILQHRWMKEHGTASSAPLDNVILKRMQGFSAMNKLKREALMLIANTMKPEEVAGLKNIFKSIDTDCSGHITVEEMKQGLREQGSVVSEEELSALVAGLDADNSGTIDYSEFLAGTLSLSLLNKREHLLAAFERFDTNGDGVLSIAELEAALMKNGGDVTAEVRSIIRECDANGDGQIDFEEFANMMTTGNDVATYSKSAINVRRSVPN